MIDPASDRQFLLIKILYAACILIGIGAVYEYFSEFNVDVKRSPKMSGKVESAYLTSCMISTGRHYKARRVFAFRLDQSPEPLGVYWSSGNYTRLQDSIQVGDEVTVYYRPSAASGVNLDVFQIEKGNDIILNYEDYRRHSIVFAYESGGLAVLLFLVAQVGTWVLKRRKSE